MRSKHYLTLAVLGAASVVITGAVLVELGRPAARPAARLTWPSGTRYDYRVEWQAETALAQGDSAGIPFASKIDLTATLRLVSHGRHEDGWLLAASFVDVGTPDVEVLGRDVFADAADARKKLVGPTAWVIVAMNGAVERIHVAPDAAPELKHLVQTVIGLAGVTTGDDSSWRATEPGPSGIARVVYRKITPTTWTRERVAYEKLTAAPQAPDATPELTARAEIAIDATGHVAKLVDDEALTVRVPGTATPLFRGKSRFALTLAGTGSAPVSAVPSLATLEARTPGELVQSGDVDRALLEQRVAGLTEQDLLDGIVRAWPDASAKRRWFTRAVALLQLRPELCDELLDVFADGEHAARLLVFDLLASAGHGPAQAAMRDAFARPAAKGLEVQLVQRFSFIARPDAASGRFVLALWQDARDGGDRDLASATSYAVGAVVRHLSDGKQHALASELNAHVRDALARARTERERIDLIASLGNTALVDNVPVLREQARDTSPEVRSRAAWALRDMPSTDARETLVALASDADSRVARAAMKAMIRQPLEHGDLEKLERAVSVDEPIAEATQAALVDLLAKHVRSDAAAVRRMLAAIADRSDNSPHLQARARVLLAQIDNHGQGEQ